MKKFLFYFLNFSWGIIMNIIGAITALVMVCTGHRPQRHAGSIYFIHGKNWGGVSLGCFFICSEDSSEHTKDHEFGHALQNAIYGPLFPFLVAIPSATRYHYRNWCVKHEKKLNTKYDDIWFEGQASKWGELHKEIW